METRSKKPNRADAERRYERALFAYLRATDELVEPLDALIADHPGFLPARLLAIGKAVAAKDAGALRTLEQALTAAEPLAGSATRAELEALAAARAWLTGEHLRAARLYSELALATPGDVLSLRLAQSCWYFLGERNCVRAVAERAVARSSDTLPGHDCALAMHAFGCAETGDGVQAEALARRALALEPRSPYAIHALAHALVMQSRTREGASFLAATAPVWRAGGRMVTHNAWHLALFRLQSGEHEAAFESFDRDLLPAAALDVSNAADATDLLWRLDLLSVDTSFGWSRLAAAWVKHLTAGFSGFLDVLAGLAFGRAGEHQLVRSLAKCVMRTALETVSAEGRASRLTTVRALSALQAFMTGDLELAHAALREVLPRLGGSLPQRELLELTLDAVERRLAAADSVSVAA